MSDRAFDDDRWPDHDGHACCFLCGFEVDPLDKKRGSYTSNAQACDGLPIHLPCIHGNDAMQLQVKFLAAISTMSDANAKRSMRQAAVVGAPS